MVTASPIFLILLLSGLIFFIVGIIFQKYPPKKMNWIYGYRTPSSMKSQERWDFAQRYSANELKRGGVFMLLISFIGLFINVDEAVGVVIGLGILILISIYLIIKTETAIRSKFNHN